MKIAFDENVSPPVLPAVRALLEHGKRGSIEIVSAYNYSERPAISDVPWLYKFHQDGGHAVVSGDIKMRGKPHERAAIMDLGLIVVFLPSQWSNWQFHIKGAYILAWWEVTCDLITTSRKRTCWQLPNSMTPDIEAAKNVTGPLSKRKS